MRNFLLGACIMAILSFVIFYAITHEKERKTELQSSGLILDQINNVGKLVVTEGHFSEVITYRDAKKYYLDMLTAKKKAVVVVNAKVSVAYDLKKIKHEIDPENKTLTITEIPEAEIDINPDIKYHDLEADLLNQFTPADHNKIRKQILLKLRARIDQSSLKTNAKNRLVSELQKLYILTNSLGWKLMYQDQPVNDIQSLIP